jgi:predicted XRE-type DNA-binding protein
VDVGTGNVFADLGFPDAEELRLKVRLAVEVNNALEERDLTQMEAAKLLGLKQPHVSELVRYRLDRFSAERLMEFLTVLGCDVEIRISPRSRRKASSPVRVSRVH